MEVNRGGGLNRFPWLVPVAAGSPQAFAALRRARGSHRCEVSPLAACGVCRAGLEGGQGTSPSPCWREGTCGTWCSWPAEVPGREGCPLPGQAALSLAVLPLQQHPGAVGSPAPGELRAQRTPQSPLRRGAVLGLPPLGLFTVSRFHSPVYIRQ